MRIEPEIGGCSIVLVGTFTPALFSPQWMARHHLISDQAADSAEIGMIHPEICTFRLDKTVVTVEATRFSLETNEAPWVMISDLAVNIFSDVLPHTPINRLGINRTVHFQVESEHFRNEIGRRLAPTQPWGEWGAEMEGAEPSERAGSFSLTMVQPRKEEGLSGHTQATVEPSLVLKGRAGIFVQINDDFILLNGDPLDGANKAVNLISERFQPSIDRSEWIIDQVMALRESVS
jgi:hypothetical protein